MNAARVETILHRHPLIVGSGIAGLATALSLNGSVVVTAAGVGDGSSALAQGGMAAAIDASDALADHVADTLRVGGGIADSRVAQAIASSAPELVNWLIEYGAAFDRGPEGDLMLGREAGHTARRIVHAGGDATGAEIIRALRIATVERTDIMLIPRTRLIDLIRFGDSIGGILALTDDGSVEAHIAPGVVLASGGIGGVYARSTNPRDVQGAGLAAAARQGATLADLEFVQFHPTALAVRDHPAPLVTEALRGEGAILVDENGTRFMVDIHPDAELAPRDVVARSIWQHRRSGHRTYLDSTSSVGDAIQERFPTVFTAALEAGIDARRQPIEIAPAEHYHMGGVATDLDGRTSISGLWACGEVASTGLHGANRLASNSLLEAAVMGHRVASSVASSVLETADEQGTVPVDAFDRASRYYEADTYSVRQIAWNNIGIARDRQGLEQALEELEAIDGPPSDSSTVAGLIAAAALERTESRGAHYRTDFPDLDGELAERSHVTPRPHARVELSPLSASVIR
ncbi:MAG: L-aspartate oxidase [Actinobacteria bacterium]|nr:MAG: L-aspartate oxidase [Actinomycetota bacterium]